MKSDTIAEFQNHLTNTRKTEMALLDPGKQHSNEESIFSALEKFKIQTELKRTVCTHDSNSSDKTDFYINSEGELASGFTFPKPPP